MTAEELEAGKDFGRYKDVDGDGIPWRTCPARTRPRAPTSPAAPRATLRALLRAGPDYIYNMERLLRKFETAATLVPQPVLRKAAQPTRAGRDLLRLHQPGDGRGAGRAGRRGHPPRRDAPARLPVPGRGAEFIAAHDTVFVVEQNRDAQMRTC
jgi:2-oxoglutarate ferredoxin oxidoreductase subunit alpha